MFETEIKQAVALLHKNELSDLARQWEELAEAWKLGQQITIVNAGLVKAGKSELYNALVDEPEHFLTGAARKTTKNERYLWKDRIYLVDTPGIDAREDDTEKAFQAFRQADLVLFLHNVNTGEYKETECQFIKRLKNCFPSEEEFLSRIWFIASWTDKKDLTGELDIVLTRMKEQFAIMGIEKAPELIILSSTRYLEGKKQNKQLLVRKSHITELRDRILSIASQLSADREKLIKKRLEVLKAASEQALMSKRKHYTESVRKRKQQSADRLHQEQRVLLNILDKFRYQFAAITRQEAEVKRDYNDVLQKR